MIYVDNKLTHRTTTHQERGIYYVGIFLEDKPEYELVVVRTGVTEPQIVTLVRNTSSQRIMYMWKYPIDGHPPFATLLDEGVKILKTRME